MEELGAEIGQLGRFGKRYRANAVAAGTNGGIAREHAVDVSPDLDFFSIDSGADDRGSEVRAAASERSRDSVRIGRDEAAHHNDTIFRQRRDRFGEPLI